MFCSEVDSVHIRKVNDYYNIDITMSKLWPPPNFSNGETYSFEIWDYSVQADFIFFLLWHEKHVLTIEIPPNQKVSTRVHVNDFFATDGVYKRQLTIYLSRKFNGTRYYKEAMVIGYWQGGKKIFDNFFSKHEPWFGDTWCE